MTATSITQVGGAGDDTKACFTKNPPRRRQMKHLALAAATAAALVLAGCGGSSSTTATTPKEPMTPTVPTMDNAAQLATLKAAHKAAMDALDKLKDDLTDATQAEVDDANAKLAALKEAITAATGVTAATKRLYPVAGIEAEISKATEGKDIAAARTRAKAALDAAEAAKDLAADGREATEATDDMEAMPAKTGSKEAQRVTTGLVPVQTGEDPVGPAAKAKDAADKAMDEYEKAKAAYARAMAAATTAAALKAQQDAEAARDKAREYAMTANTEAMKAVQAAGALKYDAGTMTYSTGEGNAKRSVMVGADTLTRALSVDHPGSADVDIDGDTKEGEEVIRVAWRRMAMGNIYSKESDGRLTHLRLFTKYFDDGGGKARLYAISNKPWSGNDAPSDLSDDEKANLVAVTGRSVSSHGSVALSNGTSAPLVHVTSPEYHRYRRAPDQYSDSGTVNSPWVQNSPRSAGNVQAASDSRNEGDLYYYMDENGRTIYVSITTDSRENPVLDGVVYGRYVTVYPADKSNYDVGDNMGTGGQVQESDIPVKPAPIPLVYDHEYIHYGIWNSMKPDGSGRPSDMGIGFVRMLEGAVKTPVAGRLEGTATYQGGWVAAVRAKGEDSTTHSIQDGMSEVTANFGDNSLTVDLTQFKLTTEELTQKNDYADEERLKQNKTFAKLAGTIDGTGFSGMKVTDIGDIGGLEATADGAGFTGEFRGNFYGPKAQEVGGVFDFDGEKKGAFRGAFGGGQNKK